jgi:hypothetical protein
MPISDDEARRAYFREYMRKQRAGEIKVNELLPVLTGHRR